MSAVKLPPKLRPAKVSNAIRRRVFETQLARVKPVGSEEVEEIGTPYGGWVLPTAAFGPGWTAYCVGAGGDIQTDLELRRRWGMTIRCIEPVPAFCERARQDAGDDAGFSVRQAAVMPVDGPVTMLQNPQAGTQSVSASGLYLGDRELHVDGRTLPTLMAEFGDARMELLKLDVEGVEYDILPTLDLRALGVRVFATQLHHNGGVRRARQLIAGLERQGYRLVGAREVVKLTFLRD